MNGDAKRQFCTFWINDEFFGIEVGGVGEVVRNVTVTDVALVGDAVMGLLNRRGEVVTAVTLRPALRCAGVKGDSFVMVEAGAERVALNVDRVGDVLAVDEARKEELPPHVAAEIRHLVRAVYGLDGCLMLELDAEVIVSGAVADV